MALLLVALLFVCVAHAAKPPPRSRVLPRDYGNTPVWPLPASAVSSGASATLDPFRFSFLFSTGSHDADSFLDVVTSRFAELIMFHPQGVPSSAPVLETVSISVGDSSVLQIQGDTDESYAMSFAADGRSLSISAPTVFGVRHALESFSQLVDADRVTGVYTVATLNITETPRFPFRGLLVDAARHWLPPNIILTIMDGLAANKMNALQVCRRG